LPGDAKPDETARTGVVALACSWMCGICSAVCRDDAVSLDGDRIRIDPERCSRCLVCVRLCPAGILEEETIDGL
jgi:ferredoxin